MPATVSRRADDIFADVRRRPLRPAADRVAGRLLDGSRDRCSALSRSASVVALVLARISHRADYEVDLIVQYSASSQR